MKLDGSATVLFMRRPGSVGQRREEEEDEEEDAAALRDFEPHSSDRSADETMDIERREGSMDGYDNDGYDEDGDDDDDDDDGYGGVDELKAEGGETGGRERMPGTRSGRRPPRRRRPQRDPRSEEEEEEEECRPGLVGVTETARVDEEKAPVDVLTSAW